MKYRALVDGEDIELEIVTSHSSKVEALVSGSRLSFGLFEISHGVYWFELDNRSVEARILPEGDGYRVQIGRVSHQVEFLDFRSRRRPKGERKAGSREDVLSPMPGRVVQILAREGETVKAGQGLIVLEAMKMQNEIRSPRDGIVAAVGVTEGTAVSAAQILLTLG